jgi:hypothetical protein
MTTEAVGDKPQSYILLPFEAVALALSVVCGYDTGTATFAEARAAILQLRDLVISAIGGNLMGFADEPWLAEHLALSAQVNAQKTEEVQ